MQKGIQNIDAVARKLEPALTRATNHRLEVVREKKQKKEEIVERRKAEAIVAKQRRNRERISLCNEKEKNYNSNIVDDTDLN